MLQKISLSFILGFLLISCNSENQLEVLEPTIIPKPQQMELGEGVLTLDLEASVFAENDFELAESFLRNFLRNGAGWELKREAKERACIFER